MAIEKRIGRPVHIGLIAQYKIAMAWKYKKRSQRLRGGRPSTALQVIQANLWNESTLAKSVCLGQPYPGDYIENIKMAARTERPVAGFLPLEALYMGYRGENM